MTVCKIMQAGREMDKMLPWLPPQTHTYIGYMPRTVIT